MTVLIAGCGDLGTEVGLRLAASGHRVVGLRRSPAGLPAPIEGVAADLGAPLDEGSLPRNIELVAYTAAADGRSVEAYRRTYLDGLRHVLDALGRAGAAPRRILFVSSTAVYGVDDGSWVDEGTPARPAADTGRVLATAEDLLRGRVASGAVVLRLAGIYGPGRTGLVDRVRAGTAVIAATPTPTNRIHRDDAAAAVVHLLTAVEDPEPIYLGVDHDPADVGEVVRFLADELGVPHPPVGVDEPEDAGVRRRGGAKRCRNDRLVASGFAFAFPTYREGYRSVLAGEGVRHP